MQRQEILKKAIDVQEFDVIIIGGGATGLGCLVDAVSRGLKALLLEQQDFGKGTSTRSTKLIHGGLRYLQQGNIKLVKEALKERGLLCQNAPHLVHQRRFVIPLYHFYETPFYGTGLKIYDALAGSYGLEPSRHLSKEEVIHEIPEVKRENLRGGFVYYDGQFDDARLLITLALTAYDLDGLCLNYIKVIDFIKENGQIKGVVAQDGLNFTTHYFKSKTVINATGVFADALRAQDRSDAVKMMAPSQGIHLVLPKKFLSKESALLVPKTDDGRVLFLVPWHDKVLVGTTDTLKEHIELEPVALDEEIEFILKEASKFLSKAPKRSDVLSVFAGLRPLVNQKSKASKAISRDHTIEISESGLVTIVGGKWTTYRKMAEDTIDAVAKHLQMNWKKSVTEHLRLHGHLSDDEHLTSTQYGTDYPLILEIIKENQEYRERIHPNLPFLKAEVIFAVRYEMAIHLEDVLSRRLRALLLDAKSTIECAGDVAKIMAKELGLDLNWADEELLKFKDLAKLYQL